MSAHTPGPWTVSKYKDCSRAVILESGEDVIARVEYQNQRANALLIAAAPDLLEACIAALSDDQPYIEKCRVAIAKATGETE